MSIDPNATGLISSSDYPCKTSNEPSSIGLDWPGHAARFLSLVLRERKDGPMWSGAVYAPGHDPRACPRHTDAKGGLVWDCRHLRLNENVLHSQIFAIDLDNPSRPESERIETLLSSWGVTWVRYPTWSHRPPGASPAPGAHGPKEPTDDPVCHRIAIPVSRPVSGAEWCCFAGRLVGMLGLADRKDVRDCLPASQGLYLPAAWAGHPREVIEAIRREFRYQEGELLDVASVLAAPWPAEFHPATTDGHAPRHKGGRPRVATVSHVGSHCLTPARATTPAQAEALLASVCEQLAAIPAGDPRHPMIRDLVLLVSRLAPHLLAEAEIRRRVTEACARMATPRDCTADIEEAIAKGMAEAQYLPLHELAWATRIVALHGLHMRYAYDTEQWYIWEGSHWSSVDAVTQVREWVSELLLYWLDQCGEIGGEYAKVLKKFVQTHLGDASSSAILSLIGKARAVRVAAADFDADRDAIGVANGTLYPRTGVLVPAAPEHMISRLLPIKYDPAATCPLFEQFLLDSFANAEVIAYLQRALGLTLTGRTTNHLAFFLIGRTRSGKGTLMAVMAALLGHWAAPVPASLLQEHYHAPSEAALHTLRGIRLGFIDEPGYRQCVDSEVFKRLTGGAQLQSRGMRKDFSKFDNQAHLWLAVNPERFPRLDQEDDAVWARVRCIPTSGSRLGQEDEDLVEKLCAELPGVLAWLVRGTVAWAATGKLHEPHEVLAATAARRESLRERSRNMGGVVVPFLRPEKSAAK